MTRSDLVMVEREVLADALAFLESEMHWSQPAPDMGEEPSNQFTYDAIPVAMALREALSSSDPEGGARGVQTSIATKQESCPESAPRTETTVRDWRKSVFTYEHDDAAGHLYYFAPQVTAPGPFLEQRHVQAIVDIASDGTFAGVELIDNMPPLIRSGGADTESDGGTSPSNETRGGAGDDCSVGKRGAWPHHDGQVCAQRLNVENQNPDVTGGESAAPNSPAVAETDANAPDDTGLVSGVSSAPNHQPHAASQGWQPIETAPRDGTPFIGAFWSIRWADSHRRGDIVRCWYQPEFDAFISSCREMTMAPGYTINGKTRELHSPRIEPVTHWMPLPAPPSPAKTGGVG